MHQYRSQYRNPWHKPNAPEYGPEIYAHDAPATKYRGFEIYHRQPQVWDVVKDGVCVTQRAGMCGAKSWIDKNLSGHIDPSHPV